MTADEILEQMTVKGSNGSVVTSAVSIKGTGGQRPGSSKCEGLVEGADALPRRSSQHGIREHRNPRIDRDRQEPSTTHRHMNIYTRP